MNNQSFIRNFAIIAHVDHGKSTLADRLMELTGTVEKGRHEEQLLDRNPISRERGITIKLAPVRMQYQNRLHPSPFGHLPVRQAGSPRGEIKESSSLEGGAEERGRGCYILNLIDTPGHVDFSYEVDRTLACVEGAILLVDATQGIQAQTIANTYKALEKNLTIIPVVNKIDMPNADVEKTKQAMMDFLGITASEIISISAKTGQHVEQVLNAIIEKIPAPLPEGGSLPLQALIFDSYFDTHKGVIAFVRIVAGQAQERKTMELAIGNRQFDASEVGIFTPDLHEKQELIAGEIGYIVTNLKDIHDVQVGDTIIEHPETSALPGYKKVHPMVFASLFPTDPSEYEHLKKALEKIILSDSALQYTAIYSQALGAGFRVGFLGLLHADVVRERLEREYNLALVLTPPQVDYRRTDIGYEEPIVRIMIITPQEYLGAVMRLCEDHRATFMTMDNLPARPAGGPGGQGKNQVTIEYEMPLSEMISDFFDDLKSVTSGYASFDWSFVRYQPVSADKLSLLLNGDEIEEFSQIIVVERSLEAGQHLTKRLKELIPRQQYEVRIQAQYKGRIIASERIAPFRKDVLMKGSKAVGGGDVGRKRKVLERQKEGKKRMKMIGKVEVPKEAFMKLFK